ncbi:MAG: flagellar protein [Bacteroidetes bacterium]|jgi:flagellar operon protein|nr:flagellar protein [Bacteroidota bacterium]
MAEYVNGVNVPFLPVGGVDRLRERTPVEQVPERSFKEVFEKEVQELKISKHAQQRLESRNITLNEADMQKLQTAIDRAQEKGAQDSLVLLRDLAFVVSVRNRTIVTAMDGDRLKENVFTNIDSAVIAE